MTEYLSNNQIENFLEDFENNSEIEFLEVGKEKDELLESAKKRGILVKGSRDLGVLKTIYGFTDKSNDNGAILPSAEFRKKFPQIIGKPMNINHDRKLVVGFYIDYRYILKENKAISYAIFFKSNFPKLWKKAKELQKAKKLSSSFEIWSPESKRKYFENGTYEMHDMEIAGGALIFEDKKTQPAFKDAKVLEMAMKEMIDDKCLVYASKYNEDEIVYCGKEVQEKEVTQAPVQQITKIKCSNCGEEFENSSLDRIKCPKCFAIVNREGQMIYPPQIMDFSIGCISCGVRNWLILSTKEDKARLKCMNCAKEFEATFATEKANDMIKSLNFVYTSTARCPQCGNGIQIASISGINERILKCKKCGLEFAHSLSNNKSRNIVKIDEIKIEKSSKKEEEVMDKKVEKASENKVDETSKKEEEIKTDKVEPEKTDEAKEKETPKVEKAEEVKENKDEIKEEVKEDKIEQPEAEVEEPTEKATEAPKEDKDNESEVEKAKEDLEKVKTVSLKGRLKTASIIKKLKKDNKELSSVMEKSSDKELKFKNGIRKLAKRVIELKKKVELLTAKANEIVSRRNKLGKEFADKLTDEEILNDDKFARAIAEKENNLLKASLSKGSEIVGDKNTVKDDDYYADYRKRVNEVAYGKKEEKKDK